MESTKQLFLPYELATFLQCPRKHALIKQEKIWVFDLGENPIDAFFCKLLPHAYNHELGYERLTQYFNQIHTNHFSGNSKYGRNREFFVDLFEIFSLMREEAVWYEKTKHPAAQLLFNRKWSVLIDTENQNLLDVYLDMVELTEYTDEETGECVNKVKALKVVSSREFLTTSDAKNSVDLDCYAIALFDKFPKIDRVTVGFYMLRQRSTIEIEVYRHHYQQLLDFYKEIVHKIIRRFPYVETSRISLPQLSTKCVRCIVSSYCTEYREALEAERLEVADSEEDLNKLSIERTRLKAQQAIIKKRLDKIDDVLKERLNGMDDGMFLEPNMHYKMSRVETVSYPAIETAQFISEYTGMDVNEVLNAISKIDNKSLNELIADLKKQKILDTTLLQSGILGLATKQYSTRLRPKKLGKR